ncbi:MAG: MFS transporter [Nitrospiraceae bacterium]|nr:MFS transporter [Nitrospiraceae bacterium]
MEIKKIKIKIQKEKIIIVLTVFIDVLGLAIIIPLLPFYVESFGVSALTLTMLFSVFSLFSFVSAPFLGALSDRIGRRPVLIASIASTAIGWFVFASAQAVWVLFLGRIIDGMAAGNLPIAQSYLVDIAISEKERTTNLGIIGSVFGIAFIAGPAIGAALSSVSHALPFYFVGAMATLNVIGALFFLPESLKQLDREKKIEFNPWRPLVKAVRDGLLRNRYAAWFFFGMAFSGMQGIFALYMSKVYGFNSVMVGAIYTGMGIAIFLNQTCLLRGFWLRHFRESSLEVWTFLANAAGFALLMVPSIYFFAAGILLNVFSQSLLRVVLMSRTAGFAGGRRRGEVLGVMSSVLSVSTIGGPLFAGFLFQIRPSLPFVLNACVLALGFLLMVRGSERPASAT